MYDRSIYDTDFYDATFHVAQVSYAGVGTATFDPGLVINSQLSLSGTGTVAFNSSATYASSISLSGVGTLGLNAVRTPFSPTATVPNASRLFLLVPMASRSVRLPPEDRLITINKTEFRNARLTA